MSIPPTDDQALQFCVMLSAGLPASSAILYFTDSVDPGEVAMQLAAWQRSKAVRLAQRRLVGKSWQEMTLNEKITAALDLHYAQLAFCLYSMHFAEANPSDVGKLNTARQALEAKLAGLAGKGDALSRFLDDFVAGKLKLQTPLQTGLQTFQMPS